MAPLTREEFKRQVFELCEGHCVVCGSKAVDAHHIMDRDLWEDGGYYLENGAAVCKDCHILAESGIVTVQSLWRAIGVKQFLPPDLDPHRDYDKWGKALEMPNREKYVKYPHTHYFDFSPSIADNDKGRLANVKDFVGYPVVITIKMDGSNMTWTSEHMGARNGVDAEHASFAHAKLIHAVAKSMIGTNYQLFGEWLYAKHSIHYVGGLALPTNYMLFNAYDTEYHEFLEFQAVQRFARMLNLETVPVLFEGTFKTDWELINKVIELGERVIAQGHEGLVVRSAYPFHYSQMKRRMAKYVRANHVQTDKHWTKGQVIPNEVVYNHGRI